MNAAAIDRKLCLYFVLALLPALTAVKDPPATSWAWFLFVTGAVYQGLIAVKSYQSVPPPPPDGAPAYQVKPQTAEEISMAGGVKGTQSTPSTVASSTLAPPPLKDPATKPAEGATLGKQP